MFANYAAQKFFPLAPNTADCVSFHNFPNYFAIQQAASQAYMNQQRDSRAFSFMPGFPMGGFQVPFWEGRGPTQQQNGRGANSNALCGLVLEAAPNLVSACSSPSTSPTYPFVDTMPPTKLPPFSKDKHSDNNQMSRYPKQTKSGQSSDFRGVIWDPVSKAWRTKIKLKNRTWYLGTYKDERVAARG